MEESNTHIFNATTVSEVLYHLKNIPNLQVFAGSTLCTKNLNKTKVDLPQSSLFIGNIAELKEITKKERYIDFGCAVTLNQILEIGKNRMPHFLYEAIESVGTNTIRNLATIGGNICASPHKMNLYAPLLALDASLEIRSFSETQHIPLSRFTEIPQGFFLTRIRVPLQDWFTSTYRKLGSRTSFEHTSSYTFLAEASKTSILDDLRIAYAGKITIRSRELENLLIGARLPLSERDSIVMLYKAEALYDEIESKSNEPKDELLKAQFLNLLEKSLQELKYL